MIRAGAVERAADVVPSPVGGDRARPPAIAPRAYGLSFADGGGLSVGCSDDPAEHEADLMAEHALSGLIPLRPVRGGGGIRRMCAECEEEESRIRRKTAPGADRHGGAAAPAAVSSLLAQPGRSLDPLARSFFEARFERSFADVAVHDGPQADEAARSIGARAFTFGSHIAFARGRYEPSSGEGRRLLAHELAHVVQGGAPLVRRDGDKDDQLTGVTLALVRARPPLFKVTFEFSKTPASFEVELQGDPSKVGLLEGTQLISASPFFHPSDQDLPQGGVYFTLPDQGDAYLWFRASEANKATLIRASVYLQQHKPVSLTIVDSTTAHDGGIAGEKGKAEPPPKFTPAEEWLSAQMLPAVKKSLAEHHSAVGAGTLIPYRSTAIQASEGPDISLIQVNKPNSKAIAGHVRVDRRKWVGKDQPERDQYAREIADSIASKLTESARKDRLQALDTEQSKKTAGEAFPGWAIELKKSVEKKLGEARAAWPAGQAPKDIPDRLTLAHVGDLVHFQIFLEREASNAAGKMVWQVAIMNPWLEESQSKDVDALVRTVREQTALMRAHDVRLIDKSDEPERANILMEPIPSEIKAKNLNANGTTVTKATNIFEMDVRIDLAFSLVEGRDILNMVGYSQNLGLRDIDVRWKVAELTEYNAEDLARSEGKPAKGAPPAVPSDLYFDLANRDIDQRTKIGLAMQRVDTAAIMRSPAYPLLETKRGVLEKFEHQFGIIPGVYLVVAETSPRPLINDKYRQIFPPSRAVLPVRVMRGEALASETVAETPEAIAAKERAKADPSLSDKARLEIDADIDRLKKQERMTQLEVVQAAEADIDRQYARFLELRMWLIADHKAHSSIEGSATEDPLLVRLTTHDRLHDTHLFETFQQLYKLYGDHAFDTSYLEQPVDSKLGQIHVLNQHLALLGEQKKESGKLQGRIEGQVSKFKKGSMRQVVATLVIAETGNAIPLLLLVGEAPGSEAGAYRYKIVDMTLSSTPIFDADKQTFAPTLSAKTPEDALHDAFITFGEDNEYDEGKVYYRFASETKLRNVPNVKTISERAQEIATFVAILGMIASIAFTGGATTPAVAAVIGAITLANAALAIYLSSRNLARRGAAGTLHVDAEALLDVLNIIASVVGVGALLRGRQLTQAAQAARASGNLASAAAGMAKVEQLGRNMLIFDTAVLGGTAVLTGWKVVADVKRIKALHLPPAEEAEVMRQVAGDAMMQGAMIAFQSVMLARSHLEMYRSKLENSRYRTFEERGWVTEDGRVTEQAPPSLRAVAKGEAPPVGEKPPVSLESDLPRIKEAVKANKARRLTSDPEHDLEIPFRDVNEEMHSFKRRREDGAWCRYSSPYCFIRDEDIERIVNEIGAFDEPHAGSGSTTPKPAPRGGKGVPGKSWGKIGGEARTLTETIQKTIERAMADLKAALGKAWLLPHIYGTKLHKVAADLFRGMRLPSGWRAIVDQPLKKSGLLDPAIAKMTVRDFLKKNAPWLIPGKYKGPFVDRKANTYKTGVPESLLSKKIGDIEPDLILVAPDGTKIVWDLAPSENAEHMAKTIVYANAIDSAGGRVQIGETYYHPERGLEIDSSAQSRFRGSSADAEGARIKLSDEKARSLARSNFGEGTPMVADLPADPKLRARVVAGRKKFGAPEPLPAGYSGSVELVEGDSVVGEVFDPKTRTWVETKNYTIHYSEGGAFIRPEAP